MNSILQVSKQQQQSSNKPKQVLNNSKKNPTTVNYNNEKENHNNLLECSPNHLLKIIENLKQENKQKDAKINKYMDQIQEQNDYIAEHIAESDQLQEELRNTQEKLDFVVRTKSTTDLENNRLENQLSQVQLQVLEMEDRLKQAEYESRKTMTLQGGGKSTTRRPSYTECVPLEYRITEAEKLLKRHPNCIPVILEPPQEGSSMANQLEFNSAKFQRKLLMPSDITFRECSVRVRKDLLDSKAIKIDPARDALYFYINRNFATCLMNETLSSIYKIHKNPDGFLYVNFAKEATFGMKSI